MNSKKPLNHGRIRSPSHPAIGLQAALRRTAMLSSAASKRGVSIATAVQKWGYRANSSFAQQVLSALLQFGLVELTGARDRRSIRLSQLAHKLLDDKVEMQRVALLRVAALSPKIHRELWRRFDQSVPSDAVLRQYLLDQRPAGKFNARHVDRFLDQFRETLLFAELDDARVIDSEARTISAPKDDSQCVSTKTSTDPDHQEYTIPLGSGRIVAIRIPVPLSSADYEQLVSTLSMWKSVLVDSEHSPGAETAETTRPSPSVPRPVRKVIL